MVCSLESSPDFESRPGNISSLAEFKVNSREGLNRILVASAKLELRTTVLSEATAVGDPFGFSFGLGVVNCEVGGLAWHWGHPPLCGWEYTLMPHACPSILRGANGR